jgi:hypothetical protein
VLCTELSSCLGIGTSGELSRLRYGTWFHKTLVSSCVVAQLVAYRVVLSSRVSWGETGSTWLFSHYLAYCTSPV